VNKRICNTKHPNVVVLSYTVSVRCVREQGHLGMHVAAPFGRMIQWAEPERMCGITALTGDESQVVSLSDRRTRPSWGTSVLERIRGWLRVLARLP
jgi:hypothetical protein